MRKEDKIIQELAGKPFSFKRFLRENKNGILTTIIFHLAVLIIFLVFKINTYRNINELGIILDFTYEPKTEAEKQLLSPEEMARLELYERILERAMRTSTQAVNITEQFEKQISTQDFVEQVEKQLDEIRSEEERKQLERLEEVLAEEEKLPDQQKEEDKKQYHGPTLISYKFLDEPYNRFNIHMPAPVYKCQGDGIVEVDILVDQSGNVVSAEPVVISAAIDGNCLAEAAVKYAILSRFSRNINAPKSHRGKIIYSFVAQ